MSITSGFFNSLGGDRRYNAEQLSSIFNGVINDGVFSNIGTAFAVTTRTGNTVNVGLGRAWFDSVWVLNDALAPITLPESELVLDRIDAIVFDINKTDAVRKGDIVVKQGTPSSSPSRPTMANEDRHKQYPIAYIKRPAGSTSITTANITNVVGTSACPFITGILQVQSIDANIAQWQAQWESWFAANTLADEQRLSAWIAEKQLAFEAWFGNLQVILDGDVATHLANEILNIKEKFNTLVKEYTIYDTLIDSDGEYITDESDNTIDGRVIYSIK